MKHFAWPNIGSAPMWSWWVWEITTWVTSSTRKPSLASWRSIRICGVTWGLNRSYTGPQYAFGSSWAWGARPVSNSTRARSCSIRKHGMGNLMVPCAPMTIWPASYSRVVASNAHSRRALPGEVGGRLLMTGPVLVSRR